MRRSIRFPIATSWKWSDPHPHQAVPALARSVPGGDFFCPLQQQKLVQMKILPALKSYVAKIIVLIYNKKRLQTI